MLFLANIGSSTAAVFKFFYIKFDSIRRKCKLSAYERQQLRHFDFNNDRYLDFSQSGDYDRNDDIISSSSLQDLKKEIKKRKKAEAQKKKSTKKKSIDESTKTKDEKIPDDDSYDNYDTVNSVAKFNLPSSNENIFDSTTYAQHLKEQSKDERKFIDIELTLPNSLSVNVETNPIYSLLNEKKTISLLEVSNSVNGKIGDAMKRIDNLISTGENAPYLIHHETSSLELNEIQRSFKNVKNEAAEATLDSLIEPKIQTSVIPIGESEAQNKIPTISKEVENKNANQKKSKGFFKAFSVKSRKNKGNKDEKLENTKRSSESIQSNIDESFKKSEPALTKTNSEPKVLNKKTPEIQLNNNQTDGEPPEYNENAESDSKKRLFFHRNKTVSLKSHKNTGFNEDRRKSTTEPFVAKATIPLDNNNLLKPTIAVSKSPSNSIQNVSQVAANSSPLKKVDSKISLYKTNGKMQGRKLSYQLSTASQFDRNSSRRSPSVNQFPFTKNQWQFIYNDFHQRHQDKAGVPLLITLSIMPLYLVAGTVLFSEFEQWDKLDAFYFSFVTLTTIGESVII